ncbi:hypothetical protein WJX72_000298 [[Myrmecia] bisecta]|uniref:Beta-galactosidase galactose-binding domain-containing protein n=1 Tax=[Myrmecia] bisecta TaxID=41462 RepID=A0AAW1PKG9_9CHLO
MLRSVNPKDAGPVFHRGTLNIDASLVGSSGHLPDTFLSTAAGFSKGVAYINGFNLGWYWPAIGPQMTLYIPGPLLHEGPNEIILLETESAPEAPSVTFTDKPDFFGPRKQAGALALHPAATPARV